MTTLLLASASPARLATLRAAGIEPLVQVSDVDEDTVLAAAQAAASPAGSLTVGQQVAVLASAKARDVAARASQRTDLVLGCDSLLELDGVGYGKPATAQRAITRWRTMRGRTGSLHTGHHLIDLASGEQRAAVSTTEVTFAEVTDSEIAAYVASGEPQLVAGAFTIDGIGGAFIRGIRGDHHGVVGLSLPLLRDLVRALGIDYPTLWRRPSG